MFEEQPQQESSLNGLRMLLAILFFALAIALGIWVILMVKDTIHGATTPALVEKIVPPSGISTDVNTPLGRFELPKPFFSGLSYFIFFLFLLIPTTIIIALLKGSAALLHPDLHSQIQRLTEAIKKNCEKK